LIFSELERRFFETTHKKSSDLEKIKFGSEKPARFRSPLSPVLFVRILAGLDF
jgi:hypothetical protein